MDKDDDKVNESGDKEQETWLLSGMEARGHTKAMRTE